MSKIEKVKFIIERLDNYIESTNSKANLILACNAVIIGGLLTGFAFGDKVCSSSLQKVLLIMLAISGLISSIYVVLAILPFMESKGMESQRSLFFFKDISSYKQEDYIHFLNDQSESMELNDLSIQIHNISRGLTSKFNKMRKATYYLLVEIFVTTFYIITIILK